MAVDRAGNGTPIRLQTERGPVPCLCHDGRPGAGGVVLVGGTDGGFDGPANGIYATLAEDLAVEGVSSLRLDFRLHIAPGDVDEGTHDILAGVTYLKQQGAGRIGLVGHSYGGAVVINAAALSRDVDAAVTLSTQTAGTALSPRIAPTPLLLVHGELDRRLPPACSRYVYERAGEPKELVILEGAKHSLRQRREDLRQLLRDWLVARLRPSA
ncbi:MAG TPA: dienelactone hydrolase family protein [Dehalococcoidia bacterium]|nr:dienelactone hydrolase family protein [Dehalococcoidia bacterium]